MAHAGPLTAGVLCLVLGIRADLDRASIVPRQRCKASMDICLSKPNDSATMAPVAAFVNDACPLVVEEIL